MGADLLVVFQQDASIAVLSLTLSDEHVKDVKVHYSQWSCFILTLLIHNEVKEMYCFPLPSMHEINTVLPFSFHILYRRGLQEPA